MTVDAHFQALPAVGSYAVFGDRRLYYTTIGSGPAMLVLHGGLGLDHTYFRPWLDALARHVELTYFDFYGNGRSDRTEDESRLRNAAWVEDIDEMRRFLNKERIILLGHSYGGYLAQEYAVRYQEHLLGLILVSTAPVLDHVDLILKNAEERGSPEQVAMVRTELFQPVPSDKALQKLWTTILPLYFKQYDQRIGNMMDIGTRYSSDAFNACYSREIKEFNVLDDLKKIRTPTLVIAGEDDWILPANICSLRLHKRLPRSQYVAFGGSGHFPFIEEPRRFYEVVSSWISAVL